jgi:hypothetical protein
MCTIPSHGWFTVLFYPHWLILTPQKMPKRFDFSLMFKRLDFTLVPLRVFLVGQPVMLVGLGTPWILVLYVYQFTWLCSQTKITYKYWLRTNLIQFPPSMDISRVMGYITNLVQFGCVWECDVYCILNYQNCNLNGSNIVTGLYTSGKNWNIINKSWDIISSKNTQSNSNDFLK